LYFCFFFFQAEDGIRDLVRSRGLGDVYKRQIDLGAAGVAIGRNIWGYSKPGKITAALSNIIHNGVSVEEAINIMNS